MGKRLIRQWVSKPLLDLEAIATRQDAVAHFVAQGMLRAELRAGMRPLADLERLVNRVLTGHIHPRDLVAMRSTLRCLPGLRALFPAADWSARIDPGEAAAVFRAAGLAGSGPG